MAVENAERPKKKLSPPPIVKFQWPQYKVKDSTLSKLKENISDEEPAEKKNSLPRHRKIIEDDEIKKLKERAVKQIKRTIKKEVKLIMGEKELHGRDRFLADGFAQEYECRKLMEIAQIAAVQGDGYTGNKSPHSEHEKFEGLTLGRAALLVYFGLMDPDDLELYLNISERGRDYVERHFNLKKKLQFNFTHLVCRTALPSSTNRSDMSHAVHADNCNLLPNGTCTKQPPAYTWRDYSAIIYLNDDFEGGEFIFAADVKAKTVQSIVKPKCGRLIGFSAGKENLHGVNGVKKGSRCAIGLWFTFNETHLETERMLAIQVLQQVQQEGTITNQLLRELKRYVTFDVPQDSKPKRNENTDILVHTKSSVLHELNEERNTRVLSNIHREKSEIDNSKTSR